MKDSPAGLFLRHKIVSTISNLADDSRSDQNFPSGENAKN